MKICIHRVTHQIGGIATEISTAKTRIIIDMGDELSLDPDFHSAPLNIRGVTDSNGHCDAVLFTHYHGDHMGQLMRVRPDIPLYAGALAKEIMGLSAAHSHSKDVALQNRINTIHTFKGGERLELGDIKITAWSVDHSAVDSYMFVIEAEGKRVLYTGDFRRHGVRGHAVPKITGVIGKVDAVITEGTTITRTGGAAPTEWDLQDSLKEYLEQYKYVFLLCATTNLDRIFAAARAVPSGKYSLCDDYQYSLVKAVVDHWSVNSSFYTMPKLNWISEDLLERFRVKGGLMFVRANRHFEEIIKQYNPAQSIILYSMWDGYRTKPNSSIPDFLKLAGTWASLHTSGHASAEDIQQVVEDVDPELVIPMHTEAPDYMQQLLPNRRVKVLADGEELII